MAQPLDTMDFASALIALKAGACIARVGWPDPTEYLEMRGAPGPVYRVWDDTRIRRLPWAPTQHDIMSDDWAIV